MKKKDTELINYDSKEESLKAMWFTKFDRNPMPMTGDIIEQDVIVELQDLDSSKYVTEKYYLFWILGIYEKITTNGFYSSRENSGLSRLKKCRVVIQIIDLDEA